MLASKAADVRCRLITKSDFEKVVACLMRGFPERPRSYWFDALERMTKREAVEDYPRYGYLLESPGEVVGVLLMIFSKRVNDGGIDIRCNLSSWCVDPQYRSFAIALHTSGVRLKGVTYTNISPAPHTRKGIEALGFRRFSDGLFIFAPILSRWRTRARVVAFSAEAPEAALLSQSDRLILAEHAAFGCRSLIGVREGRAVGFVFQTRRMYRHIIPCQHLIHCRDLTEFAEFAGAIGRYLALRGALFCVIDATGALPGLVGRFLGNREPKYFKGPTMPGLGDLAYSELVLLGR
jgi:hypothetical protein